MPANYVLLERIELNASAASVTFSNIPQTGYTDLKLVVSGRTTTNPYSEQAMFYGIGFNGQGNLTNVTGKILIGNGTSAFSLNTPADGNIVGYMSSSGATANTFGNAEIYVPNYTSSNNKSFSIDSVSESNATASVSSLFAGLWSQTAAITSVTLTPRTDNWAQYSTFSLYGLAAVGTTPTIAPKATGGNITTDGTYWIHTFNATDTFTPQTTLTCDYLVVAGGGGGGGQIGGGGGGGGFRTATSQSLSATSYTVTVGAGGSGGTGSSTNGTNGTNSSINSFIATGGGRGGAVGSPRNGVTGGSGGGSGNTGTGATGNAGSYSPSEGSSGGTGGISGNKYYGGGGGGASAAGASGTTGNGNNGGNGTANSYSGSSVTYAGGGGAGYGSDGSNIQTGGTGATGGGGNGGKGDQSDSWATASNGTAGTVNLGGGGGGGGYNGSSGMNGGAGGSGIVIIRYAI